MTFQEFPDTDSYFRWLSQEEEKERRRNPDIDPTLLMPWGGHFDKEKNNARIR